MYKYYLSLEDTIGYTEVWGVTDDAEMVAARILRSDVRDHGTSVAFDKGRLARVLTGEDHEFWGDLSLDVLD